MSITTIVVYLTLAIAVFNLVDMIKIKKENEKLKKEVEILEKRISNQ